MTEPDLEPGQARHSEPLLSVILPVRNEEGILDSATDAFARELDRIVGERQWQFVFVENGCSDRSPEILKGLAKLYPKTIVLSFTTGDYGNALRSGLLAARGTWSLILNVDHLWDPPFMEWCWANRDAYELVLGSKRADPTLNRQDSYRRILSATLNGLLNYLFNFVGADSHGMKMMKTEAIRPLAEACVMRRGQFDTELTIRAIRSGLWVAEVPIPYVEKRRARNFMIKKIGQNVIDLFRLHRVLARVPFASQQRYRRFCREDLTCLSEGPGR